MRAVNPVADEWDQDYVVFAASSGSVILSEPLRQFLLYAESVRLRPVLVTDAHAVLSQFVTAEMLRLGGYWAVRTATGAVFNGLTGYQIQGFSELWEQPTDTRERLPGLSTASTTPVGALMFDVHAHQRASATTMVGELGAQLVTALGGSELDVWGVAEPLTQVWNPAALTEVARAGMPESDRILARAADGATCATQVARTPRGLLEHAKGGVPIGEYPRALAEVLDRASSALTAVAERFQPTIGFVSLAEVDAGLGQGASAKRPEVPLAVLIGPRGVHEMEIDVEAIRAQHDAVVLGRRRVPSLLVRFSGAETGLWQQLAELARDIGPSKVLAASGVMRRR